MTSLTCVDISTNDVWNICSQDVANLENFINMVRKRMVEQKFKSLNKEPPLVIADESIN